MRYRHRRLNNFPGSLLADPLGFTHRVATLLDLDTERLQHWLFTRRGSELRCAPSRTSPMTMPSNTGSANAPPRSPSNVEA